MFHGNVLAPFKIDPCVQGQPAFSAMKEGPDVTVLCLQEQLVMSFATSLAVISSTITVSQRLLLQTVLAYRQLCELGLQFMLTLWLMSFKVHIHFSSKLFFCRYSFL